MGNPDSMIPTTRVDGSTRAITISAKRTGKADLLRMQEDNFLNYPTEIERPQTRGDCANAERPCPWVSCRHHLAVDVHQIRGSIKINFPDLEVWEMADTCSLDVADRAGITLEEVGKIMNITRERTRQLEEEACTQLARSGEADTLRDYLGHEAPRDDSPLGVAQEVAPTHARAPDGAVRGWRPEGAVYADKDCVKCGEKFTPSGPRSEYCDKCKPKRYPERKDHVPLERVGETGPRQVLELAGYVVDEIKTPRGSVLFEHDSEGSD